MNISHYQHFNLINTGDRLAVKSRFSEKLDQGVRSLSIANEELHICTGRAFLPRNLLDKLPDFAMLYIMDTVLKIG